jgi:hypothetical protein
VKQRLRHSRENGNPFYSFEQTIGWVFPDCLTSESEENWIPAFGLVEKGIDFNVTWNAFIKKHESILQRSQAFRGSA